jgi:hypothetical protein
MTGWSESTFDRVVSRSTLTEGASLDVTGGQIQGLHVLSSHPGWLLKEYRTDLSAAEAAQLDDLIAVPGSMTSTDQALVDANTSWPAARVVDGDRTVGVCLPWAPLEYFATIRSPSGRTRTKIVHIDLLAQPDDRIRKLGLPVPTMADRLAVCASVTAVAALFERLGLAYLDWSYANAFWGCESRTAYVIDVDGCSSAPRRQIETPGWPDPLVPQGTIAGNSVDRYRVARLVAHCLTGERDIVAVGAAVERLTASAVGADVCALLQETLEANRVTARPSLKRLSRALDAAVSPVPLQRNSTPAIDGVIKWEPVRKRRRIPSTTGRTPGHGHAPTGPGREPAIPPAPTPVIPPSAPVSPPGPRRPADPIPARPAAHAPQRRPPQRTVAQTAARATVAAVVLVALVLVLIAVL